MTPALSSGTSLATAWQFIRRFSEDIDFKVTVAGAPKEAADKRRAFRKEVVTRLEAADFVLHGEPLIGSSSQFFRVSFHYGPQFEQTEAMRLGLQVVTFSGTHRPTQMRAVQSLIGRATKSQRSTGAWPTHRPAELFATVEPPRMEQAPSSGLATDVLTAALERTRERASVASSRRTGV